MIDAARLGVPGGDVDRNGGGQAMLMELSVMDQRYHPVMGRPRQAAPVAETAVRS
jgi:hypothetical protein